VNPQPPDTLRWRKSSYSDTARQCVEVAQTGHTCVIRDTANRDGRQLTISPDAWTAFTRGLRDSSFRPRPASSHRETRP
jgi:hypothetical protein